MGGPFSIDNLVTVESKMINKDLSFCIDKISSRNGRQFYIHTIQDMHRGATCHTFFLPLLTKAPFQLRSISCTDLDITCPRKGNPKALLFRYSGAKCGAQIPHFKDTCSRFLLDQCPCFGAGSRV